MHQFFTNIGTEVWITLAVVVNQGLSALRNNMSKKQIAKNVKTIKDQVTPNGGGSMNDQLYQLRSLVQAYFTVMMNNDDKAQARADHSGNWVFCNSRLTEVFGMYHRDMQGRGWQVAIGSTIKERNEFVKAWDEYYKDGSPLNHTVNIVNQDSKQASLYLVTAQDIIVDTKLQFHLIRFHRA